MDINFAFKRSKRTDERAYHALMWEIFILSQPGIRVHTNILQLQGIFLDLALDESISPTLVFEKAQEASLDTFLASL
jgi:hypothetical protein